MRSGRCSKGDGGSLHRKFAVPNRAAIVQPFLAFARHIKTVLPPNRITTVQAARHLDLKYEHFAKLRTALQNRPGAGGGDE